MTQIDVRILSLGGEVARCEGPGPDGSCPVVPQGAEVPCAGLTVATWNTGDGYAIAVPGGATECPVTVAVNAAIAPDAIHDLGDDVDI